MIPRPPPLQPAASGAWKPRSANCRASSTPSRAIPAVRSPTRSYRQVCSGTTGHAEAVEIRYAPDAISYDHLLDTFWKLHDPTTLNRQGPDIGTQYRSAIFVHSDEQREAARASLTRAQANVKRPIVTQIETAGPFYPAEEYHQDYYQKNPIRYAYYRRGCGRDARVAEVWGTTGH